jgi:hypothetical protein
LIDSVHNSSLSKALVVIEGANRSGATDADGHFRIDSIPPGPHRVTVLHPLLDTLGVLMRTPELTFAAGEVRDLDLSIPSPERLASVFCTSAQRTRGPAMMVGFVRDPDSQGPAIGAKVQLVFYETDIIGRKQLRTREATVDSTGGYKICGIPGDMTGKVQVFRNGVSSGEVPAEVTNGFLALRGFSIVSQHQAVVEVKNDSGKVKRVAKGTARVSGRVLDKKGQPLRDARITIQGGGDKVALSKANGEFTLDSLPSGASHLADGRRSHLRDHRLAQRERRMRERLCRRHVLGADAAGRRRFVRPTERDRRRRGVPRQRDATAVHQAGPEQLRDDRRVDTGARAAAGNEREEAAFLGGWERRT